MKIKQLFKKKVLVISVASVLVLSGAGVSYALVQNRQAVNNEIPTQTVQTEESPAPTPTTTVEVTPQPATSVTPSPSVTPTPNVAPISDEEINAYIMANTKNNLGRDCWTVYLGMKGRNPDYKVITQQCNDFADQYPNARPGSAGPVLLQYVLKQYS